MVSLIKNITRRIQVAEGETVTLNAFQRADSWLEQRIHMGLIETTLVGLTAIAATAYLLFPGAQLYVKDVIDYASFWLNASPVQRDVLTELKNVDVDGVQNLVKIYGENKVMQAISDVETIYVRHNPTDFINYFRAPAGTGTGIFGTPERFFQTMHYWLSNAGVADIQGMRRIATGAFP